MPAICCKGGTWHEDIALKIYGRDSGWCSYLFAQLLPWLRGRKVFLLVLGSGNGRGSSRIMTKYDCSSAANPIGGICKQDLRKMLLWASKELGLIGGDS